MCVFYLRDATLKPLPGTSPNPTSPKVLRMPGCMLITLSRSPSTAGCEVSTNIRLRQDREPLAWVIGSTPSQQHHSPKWRRALSNGFTASIWAGHSWAGHVCGKQLPGAKQPCKAPLDHLGRHVAWCARRAREIRHNRLRDSLVECAKTTGSIATSEQAMPLPRDSQPAAREACGVHMADIRISEPNGTDIWVDVRVGMASSVPKELARMEQDKRREYGLGASNPSICSDGVVPVNFEQHVCPGPCAITFLHHILRCRVNKLEQGSMNDCLPGTLCTYLLHPPGHALPDVSGMLPHCANLRHPQGVGSHGLTSRAITLPYGIPRGTLAKRRALARPGLAA